MQTRSYAIWNLVTSAEITKISIQISRENNSEIRQQTGRGDSCPTKIVFARQNLNRGAFCGKGTMQDGDCDTGGKGHCKIKKACLKHV